MRKFTIILVIILIGFSSCKNKSVEEKVIFDREAHTDKVEKTQTDTETQIEKKSSENINAKRFCTCSYDTVVNFLETEYRIVTQHENYSVNFKIYKSGNLILDESVEIFGPYAISFEDFNNDSFGDLRLDNQDLNNTISHLYQWNPEKNKFNYLDSYHSVTFIKPNFFSSNNVYGAMSSNVQVYKIDNYKPIKIKEFYIDFSGAMEDNDMLLVVDQTDSIWKETADEIHEIVKEYSKQLKDAP